MRMPVLILILIWPLAGLSEEADRQIIVSATGLVSATPDMAQLHLGVTREARAASDAMAQVNKAAAQVLANIAKAGIEPGDVQTSAVNLSPVWDRANNARPHVRGYMASNELTVRVRDIDALGGLLDQLVADGANTLNGLSFSVAEPGELETAARADAVGKARAKAETLAEAAGVALGPVQSISEGGGATAPGPMVRGAVMEAAVPIAAGEVDIRVTVTMVFAIGE